MSQDLRSMPMRQRITTVAALSILCLLPVFSLQVFSLGMEALEARHFGSTKDVLKFVGRTEVPQCGPLDVRIRVAYAELNPVDFHKLSGGEGERPFPLVPGYGGSGIVEQVGEKISKKWIGKEVAFICDPSRPFGSYATHVVVHGQLMSQIPQGVTLQQAAAIPLAGCTAYESLEKLGLATNSILSRPDASLLIVGGAGGVGSLATQLARVRHPSLHIISTASSPEKSKQWCQDMGANQTIHHDEISQVLKGGREGSVDYILCLTEPTPDLFEALSKVIRPYGTICLVVAGGSIRSLDLGFCFFKAVTVTTETVFSSMRTNFARFVPSDEIESILRLMASGGFKAPLSPLLDNLAGSENWKDALRDGGILDQLASGHTKGKLVMKIEY